MLDRCLAEAGIERGQTYVTNAVKHFKWVPRGTRRIHSKPNTMEIAACFPWLEAELAAVKPKIVVALGATAAQALFGKAFRVTRDRGRPVPSRWAPHALATVHPSSLLRAPDEETRHREIARFIEDLKTGRGADALMTTPPSPKSAHSKRTAARTVLIGVVVAVARSAGGRRRRGLCRVRDRRVEMSAAGWGAMLLGIVLTLGLGVGLMSLVFISNRRGYDERGDHRR